MLLSCCVVTMMLLLCLGDVRIGRMLVDSRCNWFDLLDVLDVLDVLVFEHVGERLPRRTRFSA